MKLIDEIKIVLKEFGYEFLELGSKKALEHPKEIRIRFEGDESVELEPHLFEANDILKHLEKFEIIEHNLDILDIKTGGYHKSYYSIIIGRK